MTPRRVLMLLESQPYPEATRVFNAATTLAEHGYKVTLLCPARKGQPMAEILDGVHVYRYPRLLSGTSAPGLALEYAWATMSLAVLTLLAWLRQGFDVIHLHNPPDALVFIALPFRLIGKRIVYDNHDPVPELIQAKFGRRGLLIRLATTLEKLSCKFAHSVVAAAESSRQLLLARHRLPLKKVTVVGNGPSLRRVQALSASTGQVRRNGQTAIRYVGCLDSQDGLPALLHALAYLANDLKRRDFHCIVIGDGDDLLELRRETSRLGLDAKVSFPGYLPWAQAMQLVGEGDICVDPAPANAYQENNTPIKVREYMALGKPMVLNDLAGHRAAAADAALYATPGDEADFAAKLARLIDDRALAEEMGRQASQRFQSFFCWEKMSDEERQEAEREAERDLAITQAVR